MTSLAISNTQERFNEKPTVNAKRYLKLNQGLPNTFQKLAALVGLLVLSPLLLALIALIKLESKGPALYRQIRIGEHGRRFYFYKFRSMYTTEDPRYVDPNALESDRDGICKKYKQDPRITRIGRVIRKLSLDELPQLYNVLNGDMLLVGPRPALEQEVDCYSKYSMNRLNVKPGITGLWQISGRADISFDDQVQLDIQYIKQKNWLRDISILFFTIPAVISGRGAY